MRSRNIRQNNQRATVGNRGAVVPGSGFSRRRGMVLMYVVLSFIPLMAMCSLAVDLGRYEVFKTELRRAAVAAARAGVAQLSASTSAASTAASNMAQLNTADGVAISNTNDTITINFIKWTSVANYTVLSPGNYSQANAIRVTITRTVPLIVAQLIGIPGKDATESSIAAISTSTDTEFVSATSDPWLAGEPDDTAGSQADPNYTGFGQNVNHPFPNDIAGPIGGKNSHGQRYSSPTMVNFNVTPGSTITLTNVNGAADNDPYGGAYDAKGNSGGSSWSYTDGAANGVSEHGMSDLNTPLNSIVGVFLDAQVPDNAGTPPAPLDFSTQTARDYTSLSPKLRQPFYAGDGQTSNSSQQTITVPPNATRMFIGVQDGWEWDNNIGGFNVTITQTTITTVQ